MAEQFYDVTNSVRRELHGISSAKTWTISPTMPNVIQFTSEEFTGPLAFVQFWLDTIGDWERETGRKALVALSCTKDVQDAILADPQRDELVDVVQFKYWWLTDKGIVRAERRPKSCAAPVRASMEGRTAQRPQSRADGVGIPAAISGPGDHQ